DRALHSFPTRRSSDLGGVAGLRRAAAGEDHDGEQGDDGSQCATGSTPRKRRCSSGLPPSSPAVVSAAISPAIITSWSGASSGSRSEEHTSELQSPYDL